MHSEGLSFTIPLPRGCTDCRSTQLNYRGPTNRTFYAFVVLDTINSMCRAYARRFDPAADEVGQARFSQKLLTLSLDEFLRRFLLHILPKGFVRIRNFGFLANRKRSTLVPLCFQLLASAPQPQAEAHASGTKDSPSWRCPKCGGPMKVTNASPQQNSSFVLLQRSPLPHEALSPTRKLYPLRRANYFSVSLPNRSFLAPPFTTTWAILFPLRQFSGHAVSWVAPDSTVSAHLKLTPPLN